LVCGNLIPDRDCRMAGDAADVTQSMLFTAWGGNVDGKLLDVVRVDAFSPTLILMLLALAVTWAAWLHGFPT
jgi:hypothetical protein